MLKAEMTCLVLALKYIRKKILEGEDKKKQDWQMLIIVKLLGNSYIWGCHIMLLL